MPADDTAQTAPPETAPIEIPAADVPVVDVPVVAIPPVAVPPVDMEMDMAALLDSEDAQPNHLRRGEIVEGMIMGSSPDGLIVDVGTKT